MAPIPAPTTPSPRETTGQWSRIVWLDSQIRDGAFPSVADLQEEFGIARRMAFNTVAFLRDSLGAPIAYHRGRTGYHYTDPTYALPSVFLQEGELLALLLAEQLAHEYLGTPLESALRETFRKLGRYLPDEVRVQLGEVADRFRFSGGGAPTVPVALLLDLERAVRERCRVRILYYAASRDETREREIEPHYLTNVSGDWMVAAWDRLRGGVRDFMVSRILEHSVLEERFICRPELEQEGSSRHAFRTERGLEPYDVVVRFDAYQARWIRERIWHPSQQLEELPGGGVILRLTVAGEGDLLRWVLGYGSHVEVMEPLALREKVAAELRRAAGQYAEDAQ